MSEQFKFPTHSLRRNSRGKLSFYLNYNIFMVLFCAISENYWKEGFYIIMPKSLSKEFMHKFLHFVVSSQRKFYTLDVSLSLK